MPQTNIGAGATGMLVISVIIVCCSCKKLIEVDPPKIQITSATVYSNDITAQSAVRGIYSEMYREGFASGGLSAVSLIAGLSADELTLYASNADQQLLYTNSILPSNSIIKSSMWESPYKIIYYANSLIEGLSASSSLTPKLKTQLTGEGKFIRAFCYFYLVNLFGDVPLILTTDYTKNAVAARLTSSQVYAQVINDLLDAQATLPPDYSNENGYRIRASKWAATALLARVYLYRKDWTKAAGKASELINNSLLNLEPDLNNVFLAASKEGIWQLMPVVPGQNTNEALTFILTTTPNNTALSNSLLNTFETGDKRKTSWVSKFVQAPDTFYFPYKYKIKLSTTPSEYSMVLRLAEQYLIRAEARAHTNDPAGSLADINTIRTRAGIVNIAISDTTALLKSIQKERRIEFFSEWGHRWLDLKRTSAADSVLVLIKAPNWQSADQLYPIPQTELLNNSNLIQNPGY